MIRKKVVINPLDASSIDRALDEIRKAKKDLEQKMQEFTRRLCESITSEAQRGFNQAPIDDRIGQGMRKANVSVSFRQDGNRFTITATGPDGDAVFAEFGAGVYYNGTAGTSPHEWANEASPPFLIGEYGKGYGRRNVWGFYDDKGDLVKTRGTPASMPLFSAVQNAIETAKDLAKEVFQ